jgi:hypothetical protein
MSYRIKSFGRGRWFIVRENSSNNSAKLFGPYRTEELAAADLKRMTI